MEEIEQVINGLQHTAFSAFTRLAAGAQTGGQIAKTGKPATSCNKFTARCSSGAGFSLPACSNARNRKKARIASEKLTDWRQNKGLAQVSASNICDSCNKQDICCVPRYYPASGNKCVGNSTIC